MTENILEFHSYQEPLSEQNYRLWSNKNIAGNSERKPFHKSSIEEHGWEVFILLAPDLWKWPQKNITALRAWSGNTLHCIETPWIEEQWKGCPKGVTLNLDALDEHSAEQRIRDFLSSLEIRFYQYYLFSEKTKGVFYFNSDEVAIFAGNRYDFNKLSENAVFSPYETQGEALAALLEQTKQAGYEATLAKLRHDYLEEYRDLVKGSGIFRLQI